MPSFKTHTSLIRIKRDSELSGYAVNRGKWIFLNIGYNGCLNWETISKKAILFYVFVYFDIKD
jgi:hypothetical protein